jgi:hypothetical protein
VITDAPNLFNLDRALTPAERKQLRRRYQPRGYAALPGSGPEGKTCGGCKHLVRRRMSRTYLKCGLMRNVWTCGSGTDIQARSSACRNWEKNDGSQESERSR